MYNCNFTMQRITVKWTNALLLVYGIILLQESNVTAEITFVNLKGSSILLDGYEPHNHFMSSVELIIGEKLKNTLTYTLNYSDTEAGFFLSVIRTPDYCFLQFFHSILTSDIIFANFLLGTFTQENGIFSNWLMTNINLPEEHFYKVVKTLSEGSRIGLSPLPNILLKEIIILNMKYDYFHKACSRGDSAIVEWAIQSGISLDEFGLEGLQGAWKGKHQEIVKVLIGNRGFPSTNITYFSKLVNDQSQTLLHFAAETDNIEYILSLLKAGAKINAVDVFGKSPLQRAIEAFKTPVVSLLLSNGANMNHETESADSMLHITIRTGNYEAANLLIKEGFQIDRKNGDGFTAFNVLEGVGFTIILNELQKLCNLTKSKEVTIELFEMHSKFIYENICIFSSKEIAMNKDWNKIFLRNLTVIVKMLLKKGAQSDLKYEDKYKLLVMAIENKLSEAVHFLLETGINDLDVSQSFHSAILTDDTMTLKYLLDAGADMTLMNIDGWKPIHTAAFNGNLQAMKFLLEKGDDVNSKSNKYETGLHIAISADQRDIVNLLLEKGANIKLQDADGMQAIHIAALKGRAYITLLLLANHANPNARDFYNKTPLFHASLQGFETVAKILLDNGASVNARDSSARTPLQVAVWNGNPQVVSLLLNRGANINAKDIVNKTALYDASTNGMSDIVKILINRGADISISDDQGWTPLHTASYHKCTEVVKLLLDKGADVNAMSMRRETPLYLAAQEGHYYIASSLINKGANVNTVNKKGITPLQAARSNGFEYIVNLLEEKGAL